MTIDKNLLADAKAAAAQRHTTLGRVIEDALRDSLAPRRGQPGDFVLPSSGHGGLMPGVDLLDRDAMAELLGDPDWKPRAAP